MYLFFFYSASVRVPNVETLLHFLKKYTLHITTHAVSTENIFFTNEIVDSDNILSHNIIVSSIANVLKRATCVKLIAF